MGSLTSIYYQSLIDKSFYNNNKLSLSIGSLAFIIGQLGNLYHHYLLRINRLKSNNTNNKNYNKNKNKYVIPKGGLFDYIWTPHYLFELVAWYGISIVSKHLNFYLTSMGITSYLIGRAIVTKKWYHKKFQDECPNRFAIIPFII